MSSNFLNVTVRANGDGSRDYYQHDNRRGAGGGGGAMPGRGRNRHKNYGRKNVGGYQKDRSVQIVDGDGDISMMGDDEPRDRGRFAPYANPGSNRSRGGGNWRGRGGGGSKGGRSNDAGHHSRGHHSHSGGGDRRGRREDDDKTWKKIIIPYGRRLEKDFVLRILSRSSTVPFIPINYHTDGNMAVFYVEDCEAGAALGQLSNKLFSSQGQKMTIIVRPSGPPTTALPKESIEQLKVCISRRFNPAVSTVDLSCFHQDMALKAGGHYLPLNRPSVASCAVETIQENVTNVSSKVACLNLSGNKLSTLEIFAPLINKMCGLKVLLLADNLLSRPFHLERIKEIGIEELTLKGNPIVKQYRSQTDLVDTLRKRFPKLVRLDGETLPPLIGFDIEDTGNIHPSRGSFFASNDARQVAVQFLEQYFALYDSVDRQSLIDAYHDSAVFALSAASANRGASVAEYMRFSRNLLRVADSDRRQKLLYRGKIDIVACLKRLPRTQHDPASFSIDVPLATQTMISVTTSGIFKEVNAREADECLRAFSRTFILVPNGSGSNVVNETLIIMNPTAEQTKAAFRTPAPTPSPSPIPGTSTAGDPQKLQQQMIAAFSLQSGMTAEWSIKCLQDNNWNFDKAATVFAELNAKGSIPREAFAAAPL